MGFPAWVLTLGHTPSVLNLFVALILKLEHRIFVVVKVKLLEDGAQAFIVKAFWKMISWYG